MKKISFPSRRCLLYFYFFKEEKTVGRSPSTDFLTEILQFIYLAFLLRGLLGYFFKFRSATNCIVSKILQLTRSMPYVCGDGGGGGGGGGGGVAEISPTVVSEIREAAV